MGFFGDIWTTFLYEIRTILVQFCAEKAGRSASCREDAAVERQSRPPEGGRFSPSQVARRFHMLMNFNGLNGIQASCDTLPIG